MFGSKLLGTFILVWLGLLAVPHLAIAQGTANSAWRAKPSQSAPSSMRIYGHTAPPIGYVQLCQRDPAECRPAAVSLDRMELTAARLAEVAALNRQINLAIRPATDKELHGVDEHWSYPTLDMRGDCEDYVLLKRKLLMELGWPASTLLITVVRDERKEGHAVLTLRTSQGDFILDNKNDEVLAWHRTPYEFVMRQSYLDPNRWMSLEPDDEAAALAVAGVRSAD